MLATKHYQLHCSSYESVIPGYEKTLCNSQVLLAQEYAQLISNQHYFEKLRQSQSKQYEIHTL